MTAGVGFLAALLIVGALGGAGFRLPEERATAHFVRVFVAGALGVHLLLAVLDAAGIRWTLGWVAAGGAVALWIWSRVGQLGIGVRRPKFGLGDLLGAAVFACFAWYVLSLQAVTPDFYYHWGLKARRFLFAGEMDVQFLLGFSAWRYHPEYPCLWIDLLVLPGLATESFSIRAGLTWTLIVFGLMLVVARQALSDATDRVWLAQILFAIFALSVGSVALIQTLGGQADFLISFAFVAAIPALLDPERRSSWREIVLAAALAAASKVEGLPLACALLVCGWIWRARGGGSLERRTLRTLGQAALGGLVVAASAAIWLVPVVAWDLNRAGTVGGYRWERFMAAVEAVSFQLLSGAQGWGPFVLLVLLIPALLWSRRARAVGAVAALQFLAYLVAYSGGGGEVEMWVAMSFPRLLFHVLPAILLTGSVLLADWVRGESRSGSSVASEARAPTGLAAQGATTSRELG